MGAPKAEEGQAGENEKPGRSAQVYTLGPLLWSREELADRDVEAFCVRPVPKGVEALLMLPVGGFGWRAAPAAVVVVVAVAAVLSDFRFASDSWCVPLSSGFSFS